MKRDLFATTTSAVVTPKQEKKVTQWWWPDSDLYRDATPHSHSDSNAGTRCSSTSTDTIELGDGGVKVITPTSRSPANSAPGIKIRLPHRALAVTDPIPPQAAPSPALLTPVLLDESAAADGVTACIDRVPTPHPLFTIVSADSSSNSEDEEWAPTATELVEEWNAENDSDGRE
jgi:hypothetical protein